MSTDLAMPPETDTPGRWSWIMRWCSHHRAELVSGIILTGLLFMPSPVQAEVRLSGEAGGSYALRVTSYRDMPFRTVVRQQYDFSCGSASLATLLRHHYGHPAQTEERAFRAMFAAGDQEKIRRDGFSMLDMKVYLEQLGYTANGFRAPIDRIKRIGVPVITIIMVQGYTHFVVIKGVQAGRVLVGDPAFGLVSYRREEFEEIWSGVVLAIVEGPGTADARAIFNSPEDWQQRPRAPLGATLPRGALADVTTALPMPHQISPIFSLDLVSR